MVDEINCDFVCWLLISLPQSLFSLWLPDETDDIFKIRTKCIIWFWHYLLLWIHLYNLQGCECFFLNKEYKFMKPYRSLQELCTPCTKLWGINDFSCALRWQKSWSFLSFLKCYHCGSSVSTIMKLRGNFEPAFRQNTTVKIFFKVGIFILYCLTIRNNFCGSPFLTRDISRRVLHYL